MKKQANGQKARRPAKTRKRVSGRQRLTWPVIDGLEATANIIGAPPALVRSVKRAGSPAFLTGNRVDVGLLLPDLFRALATESNLPKGISTPQDWLATEKARREWIKRQADEKTVMPTADAIRHANEAGALFMAQLERMGRELPPVLAGHPASSVAARLETEIENVRRHLKIKMAEVGK